MKKNRRRKSVIQLSALFMLIVFSISMLSGCKKEVQLNDYKVEDIEDDQVVFVYLYDISFNGISYLWLINKKGECKVLDMMDEEKYGYIKEMSETSEEFLQAIDECMADPDIANTAKKLEINAEMLNYCINVPEIELEREEQGCIDAGQEDYYVVCGTGEKRHLVKMKIESFDYYVSDDEVLNQMCQEIFYFCMDDDVYPSGDTENVSCGEEKQGE